MLHDLVIVGAGPIGAALALALADGELDVVVLDARREGETLRGDRSLALSHGSRLILERLDVWSGLVMTPSAVTPITDIDISQAGGFGVARLSALDVGLPALGYVVSYRALQSALDAALAMRAIDVRWNTPVATVGGTPAYAAVLADDSRADPITARLVAVADGTGAAIAGVVRHHHDYGQVALIAKLWRTAPHEGLAYERFTPEGPVALLPEGDHYGLVWTATPARAQELIALDGAAFLTTLAQHFGGRISRFASVGERRTFPLVLEFAQNAVGTRCVALGNAAQALHPVAGQGFNLGLRDAYELAQIVLDTSRDALGDRAMLARYARARRSDRYAGVALTHGLVKAFGNDLPFVRWPRGLALAALDTFRPAKRAFTRAMLFGFR